MTEFWSRLGGILWSSRGVIDRPRGSRRPNHPEIVYPLDYGYVDNTKVSSGHETDVSRGTAGNALVGIVCTADIEKRDAELKLLIGCREDEIEIVVGFHNNRFMSAVAVRRG